MPKVDYMKGVAELDDIGNKMTLGYKRGFKWLRLGIVLTFLALPLAFIDGVLWLIVMVTGLASVAIGSAICGVTSRQFRREMAKLEREYEL